MTERHVHRSVANVVCKYLDYPELLLMFSHIRSIYREKLPCAHWLLTCRDSPFNFGLSSWSFLRPVLSEHEMMIYWLVYPRFVTRLQAAYPKQESTVLPSNPSLDWWRHDPFVIWNLRRRHKMTDLSWFSLVFRFCQADNLLPSCVIVKTDNCLTKAIKQRFGFRLNSIGISVIFETRSFLARN